MVHIKAGAGTGKREEPVVVISIQGKLSPITFPIDGAIYNLKSGVH